MSLVGSTIMEQFYNFFMPLVDNNLIGLSGLAGNIRAESNFEPHNLQNTYEKAFNMTDEEYTQAVDSGKYTNFVYDKAGYGFAQWTYWSRKKALLEYAQSKGVSIGDTEMQLERLYQELKDYGLIDVIRKGTSIREVSNVILFKFEAPADQSERVQKTRAQYGQEFYDSFKNYKKPDNEEKEETKVSIKIVEKIATQNPCYKAGRKIDPKGEMLHSVGCSQPDPLVFVRIWQSSNAEVCVHAVVGVEPVVYVLLPYNWRAWHCGSGANGSGNNTLISLEMTEPATIKYTGGGNWIETGNGANTKAHVLATYRNAVEFFAYLAKKYGFNPENSNVVMSHSEGHKKGIASNHGDVEHIWNKFGLSMNQFRKDVKAAMAGNTVTTVPSTPVDNSSDDTSNQKINPLSGTVRVIYEGNGNVNDGINIRTAPSITSKVDHIEYNYNNNVFTVVGISADEKWYKLKSGLFITTIPDYVKFTATEEQKASTAGTGYYRVRKSWSNEKSQIGAFKDKNNAIELCKQNSGYKVFDNSGKEIYPLTSSVPKSFKFRVTIPDLRIRKGPGTTYDYWKTSKGVAEYTGKNTFTIVDTAEGPGAKLWGLLKSGEKDRNRWIALDDDYGQRV